MHGRTHPPLLFATLTLALVLAACGGQAADSVTAAGPSGSDKSEEPYAPVIDPANFVDVVDNPYWPLIPGTTFVYEGESEEGFEHIEVNVTHDTKKIMGVDCLVVHDTVWLDGEMIEDTFDWYAQDKDGNVWYFGEDVSNYENGELVDKAGSWEVGVDGALPGVVMWATPTVGEPYRQEYYAGVAEDMAQVLSLTESASVAYGTFDNLLMTKEWTPLEPDLVEHKYYASGVGMILEVAVEGGSERMELVEIRTE
jgi:hypothetical protein